MTKTGDDILLYLVDGAQFDALKYSDEALEKLVKGNKNFAILRVNRVGDAGKNYKFLNAVGEYRPQIAKAEGKNFAAAAGKEVVGVELRNQVIGKASEETWDLIDGIRIVDGKVGGKIPVDDFKKIRQLSTKNADAKSITLGKYFNDSNSYIAKAGHTSSYFDLGYEWNVIKEKYGLSNREMFEYFNRPFLDDAIASGKTIRFSHNPLDFKGTFLADEWEHIKETLKLSDVNLVPEGGFWYVR